MIVDGYRSFCESWNFPGTLGRRGAEGWLLNKDLITWTSSRAGVFYLSNLLNTQVYRMFPLCRFRATL